MASHAPNSSAAGAMKHGRRQPPVRRTGILATDSNGWSPPRWNAPVRRLSLFKQDEPKVQERVARSPANKALLIGIQYEGNDSFQNLLLAHRDIRSVKNMLISE